MNDPKPGSDDAVAQGCTCGVVDNGHGEGCWRFDENGKPLFWCDADCPLHGNAMVSRLLEAVGR